MDAPSFDRYCPACGMQVPTAVAGSGHYYTAGTVYCRRCDRVLEDAPPKRVVYRVVVTWAAPNGGYVGHESTDRLETEEAAIDRAKALTKLVADAAIREAAFVEVAPGKFLRASLVCAITLSKEEV